MCVLISVARQHWFDTRSNIDESPVKRISRSVHFLCIYTFLSRCNGSPRACLTLSMYLEYTSTEKSFQEHRQETPIKRRMRFYAWKKGRNSSSFDSLTDRWIALVRKKRGSDADRALIEMIQCRSSIFYLVSKYLTRDFVSSNQLEINDGKHFSDEKKRDNHPLHETENVDGPSLPTDDIAWQCISLKVLCRNNDCNRSTRSVSLCICYMAIPGRWGVSIQSSILFVFVSEIRSVHWIFTINYQMIGKGFIRCYFLSFFRKSMVSSRSVHSISYWWRKRISWPRSLYCKLSALRLDLPCHQMPCSSLGRTPGNSSTL